MRIEIFLRGTILVNRFRRENRIIKEKGKYYLIGQDKWTEDENGDFKEIKIKL